MVAKSPRSTSGTTRRRRVKKDEDTKDTAGAAKDDASDVIFEESDGGPAEAEEKPKPARRKKSARRRKPAEDEVENVREEEPVAETPRRRTSTAKAPAVKPAETEAETEDRREVRQDERGSEEPRGDASEPRESTGDGEGDGENNRPRRRRRGRRGRRNNNEGTVQDDRGGDRGAAAGARRGGRGRGNNRTGGGGGGHGRGGENSASRFDHRRGGGASSGNDRPRRVHSIAPGAEVFEGTMEGVLELHPKQYGFLRDPAKNYIAQESDPFVPSSLVEKARLREGVMIKGEVGAGVRDQGPRLHEIESIDGLTIEEYAEVKHFEDLIPVTPYKRIRLETGPRPVTMRVMDLLTPVGMGQRALIVAPPRTGKTMLLQDIANAVTKNHPDIHLMVLLIDERPEEVTEMVRNVKGEVIASSMDRDVESHVRMSQLMIERAKRMAESGRDVFVLMDSITRMARAFNKWAGGGRDRGAGTMSGGLHIKALDIPKRLFGTARQFENGGSLTIAATALIDTGGRMDEVIFQEFKGTGNMELVLSRDLADRRIWPAIDITRSGTRHEEKLFTDEQLEAVIMLRRSLISLSPVEAMESLTRTLERFPTNDEFLAKVKAIL